MEISEVRKFLEGLKQEDIVFDKHFYKRTMERPVSESLVRSFLSKPEKLEKIETGRAGRFKAWYVMSRKYSLVLIIEITGSKSLKVISAWNSNRKWQDKLKQ